MLYVDAQNQQRAFHIGSNYSSSEKLDMLHTLTAYHSGTACWAHNNIQLYSLLSREISFGTYFQVKLLFEHINL